MSEFDSHLVDACTYAEAGFHFEEGGCFAMAEALHGAFLADGKNPRLKYAKDFVHVMVEVDGSLFDHQGRVFTPQKTVDIHIDDLRVLAAQHGQSMETLEGDKVWAEEIIENARRLASIRNRIVSSAMENFAITECQADDFFNLLRSTEFVTTLNQALSDTSFEEIVNGKLSVPEDLLPKLNDKERVILTKIYDNPHGILCLQDMIARTVSGTFWDAVPDEEVVSAHRI